MEDSNAELMKLASQFRSIVLEKHTVPPNADAGGCIFHYTSLDALIKIVRSGEFWTTNVHCLNDPHEVDFGINACRDFLVNVVPMQPNHDIVRQAAKVVLDDYASILAPSSYQFVASFSLAADLLSQWRAYADDGGGVSIGFDAYALLDPLRIDYDDLNYGRKPGYMPAYLVYEASDQQKMLQEVYLIVTRFVDVLGHRGKISRYTPKEIAAVLAYGLSSVALFFKSNFFKEEQEMRLLVSNVQELASAKTPISAEVRASPDGRLITYRPLSLKDASGLLPIREIVVGPKADFETARKGIEALLISRGYEKRMPEIRKSAGALR